MIYQSVPTDVTKKIVIHMQVLMFAKILHVTMGNAFHFQKFVMMFSIVDLEIHQMRKTAMRLKTIRYFTDHTVHLKSFFFSEIQRAPNVYGSGSALCFIANKISNVLFNERYTISRYLSASCNPVRVMVRKIR